MTTSPTSTISSNYLDQMTQGGSTALTGTGGFGSHLDSLTSSSSSSSSSLSGTVMQSNLDNVDLPVASALSSSEVTPSSVTSSDTNLASLATSSSSDYIEQMNHISEIALVSV